MSSSQSLVLAGSGCARSGLPSRGPEDKCTGHWKLTGVHCSPGGRYTPENKGCAPSGKTPRKDFLESNLGYKTQGSEKTQGLVQPWFVVLTLCLSPGRWPSAAITLSFFEIKIFTLKGVCNKTFWKLRIRNYIQVFLLSLLLRSHKLWWRSGWTVKFRSRPRMTCSHQQTVFSNASVQADAQERSNACSRFWHISKIREQLSPQNLPCPYFCRSAWVKATIRQTGTPDSCRHGHRPHSKLHGQTWDMAFWSQYSSHQEHVCKC